MNTQINQDEVYEDELIRLVSSNSDTSSQYVIFQNINDDIFAINVAKVEELIQNKNLTVSKSTTKDSIIYGVTKIRDNMITLVDFDRWLGSQSLSSPDTHKLIILCNYANKRMGIVIKNVVGIQSIDSSSMYLGSDIDEKTAYIAELTLGKKVLCNIFDSDRLVTDIFPSILESNKKNIENSNISSVSNKLILIAEDSKLIQIPMGRSLSKLNYKYEIYDNGKLMLDRLYELDPSEVGLIISDIEMPVMDGMEMLEKIYNNEIYNKIPIIVNTNMANSAIVKKAQEFGVLEVVKKLDLYSLNKLTQEYCLK